MAHPNIDKRRMAVAMMMKSAYTSKDVSLIAKKFNCHRSAISSDIISLLNTSGHLIYPCKRVKAEVLKRDKYTCQYCGLKSKNLCIDHVIPTIMRGVGYEYNLVASCGSCNSFKGRHGGVWMPNNWRVLQSLNEKWFRKIKRLAKIRKQKKVLSRTPVYF